MPSGKHLLLCFGFHSAVFIAMQHMGTYGVEFPIAQRVFNDVYSLDFVEWCEHLTILEEFI